MKKFLMIACLALLPGLASADWYVRYTTGPRTNTPTKAARVTADALMGHVANIEAGGGLMGKQTPEDSHAFVKDFAQVCYAPVQTVATVADKPVKPIVCVWDRLSAAKKARVAALGYAPE